jgi:NADH-quinone oxidoreductase E subunit
MDQLHVISDGTYQKIQALMAKYPRKRSALIPSLLLAQRESGHISTEMMLEMARIFDLSPTEVHEVVSFYSMLYSKPMGKYVIQVCTNISCQLCNAEEIAAHLVQRLGIQFGETTADKRYTLVEVECLGSCGTSPVIQINEDYHENLTPEKLDTILDSLQ